MNRGLYAATTGMINQRRILDVIANNMANVNTPGYKRDQVISRSFRDELLIRVEGGQSPKTKPLGPYNCGVYVDHIAVSFDDGILKQTDRMTDVALRGQGFFTVLTDEGERYTRDGNFNVNNQGVLVTERGLPVAGTNGPIWVGNEEFKIDKQGNIIVNGIIIDTLRISSFNDISRLEKIGNNMFVNIDPQNEEVEFSGEVLQGFLEGSNANPLNEITSMIVATRSYESNQRVIQMIDKCLEKAANEVGRV